MSHAETAKQEELAKAKFDSATEILDEALIHYKKAGPDNFPTTRHNMEALYEEMKAAINKIKSIRERMDR